MTKKVFCIFKLQGDSEPTLWKIYEDKDLALQWIAKYSGTDDYIWEEWTVHKETP